MRGLLVTPWFAAGAGFVIAAGLALNSPHTVLTYKPDTVLCRICKQAPPQPGSLASASPGVRIKTTKPSKKAHSRAADGHTSTIGVDIGYRVVWHKDGEFGAIISVPADQTRHGWSLRFAIPGTRITHVWGAQWQPATDGHSGIASMSAPPKSRWPTRRGGGHHGPGHRKPGHHGPGHGGWPGGHQGNGQALSPSVSESAALSQAISLSQTVLLSESAVTGQSATMRQAATLDQVLSQSEVAYQQAHGWGGAQDDVRFLVIAAGKPVTPTHCVLNGTSCHFG